MSKPKGIMVTLIGQKKVGNDDFGYPLYEESEIQVDDVLVSPTLSDDVVSQLSITGKKAVYALGIPKGDTNDWEDKEVRFFGQRWKTFGAPLEGIEELVPLRWNKKVMVERYG